MPAIVSLTDATSDSCTIPDLWDLDCVDIQDSGNLTNNDLAIRQFIIVLRFCLPPIVMTCDTEKAILQISANPAYRDATRFLWFANSDSPSVTPSSLFTLISSPFLLGASIQHHLAQQDDKTASSGYW
eukprot:scpid58466/ scgid31333/ 